jgi:hypothetical protein
VPGDTDLLKLDIDGYDGPVLREILRAGFRPKVLQLEVQPEIPPPIEFAVLYDPAYRCADDAGKVGGFYGASLGYVSNLGRRFGYFPVQVDFVTGFTHDVTLVADRYRDLVVARFGITERNDRDLFLDHPPGYSHFRTETASTPDPGATGKTTMRCYARSGTPASPRASTSTGHCFRFTSPSPERRGLRSRSLDPNEARNRFVEEARMRDRARRMIRFRTCSCRPSPPLAATLAGLRLPLSVDAPPDQRPSHRKKASRHG